MFHTGFPAPSKAIVFLASASYDPFQTPSGNPGKTKGPAHCPPALFFSRKSRNLDDRSQAFGAQHFGLFPFSIPDRGPLQVGFKSASRGPLGERAVMTEGEFLSAMFAGCHCSIPS
jgi:hypothetical protein